MDNSVISRHAAIEIIRKMPNKTPIFADNRDVIDRAAAQAEIMLLPPADVYCNIIALLDSVKDMCRKQSYCRDCPLSLSYTHENDEKKYYYCRLEDTPERWQIDSARDDEVLYDVSDIEKRYIMEEEE